MKSKLLTFLPALLLILLLKQGLNEPIRAQQTSAPPNQSTTPATQNTPAPTAGDTGLDKNGLPPGPGRDTTTRVCSGCHAFTVITTIRRSADDWAGIADQMRSRGASGTDEDFDQIVAYLAANFGPSNSLPPAAPAPPKANPGAAKTNGIDAVRFKKLTSEMLLSSVDQSAALNK
jgi:hypothetical protein